MSEKQLKEFGQCLTGLNVLFDGKERTSFIYWPTQFININCFELSGKYNSNFQNRGYSKLHLFLQVLLHEIAHYKQYLKYGKDSVDIFMYWIFNNKKWAENTADRYALMYYRRFLKDSLNTPLTK